MKRGPIFIGGLAYSGKTPLRLILSAHPHLALTRRTYMWTRFYNRFGDLARRDNFERCLEAMMTHKEVRRLESDPNLIRKRFYQGELTYARLFALFHERHADRLGKSRWGDQLGFVERFADPIMTSYPTAKMIHMIRDPRDRWQASMTNSRSRKGKLGWSIAMWLQSASLSYRNQERYPDRYKVIRYESLILEPEETIRDICAFIGEDVVTGMLASARDSMPKTKEMEKRNKETMGTVRGRAATGRDIAFAQAYTRDHLLAFDYPIHSMEFSLTDRLKFHFIDWPANRISMAVWNTLQAGS